MGKNILILTNKDTGLYYFRKELLSGLLEKGYHVSISVPEGDFTDDLRLMGCEIIPTEVDRRGRNPFRDLQQLITYRKLLNEIKPKVVLTYTIKPNIYGGLAAISKRIPYITNVTGLGTEIEKGGIASKALLFLYGLCLRKANCVFVQNATIDKLFEAHSVANGRRIVIPGSGVNLDVHKYSEYPPDGKELHFLFIGRVMQDKGSDELLKAAEIIKQKYSNAVFDIVGRCEEEKFTDKINYANENGTIVFHGFQSDVTPFLEKAHALIQPSYHEGLSNVLLEAAATGRPVLSSNVPGCKETFDEGVTGIGFEAKSVDSLCMAIEKFIALPYEQKREMGKKGRLKVEKEFNRQTVVDYYMKEIENIEGFLEHGFIQNASKS